MAPSKKELVVEAQALGITVLPEDTIATLTKKIADKNSGKEPVEDGAAEGAAEDASLDKGIHHPDDESKFAPLPAGLKRIKATPEEVLKLQAEERLVGYDPKEGHAIVKDE
jgi:hypothetical protein